MILKTPKISEFPVPQKKTPKNFKFVVQNKLWKMGSDFTKK